MTKIKVMQKSINCVVYIINILVAKEFLKYALSNPSFSHKLKKSPLQI